MQVISVHPTKTPNKQIPHNSITSQPATPTTQLSTQTSNLPLLPDTAPPLLELPADVSTNFPPSVISADTVGLAEMLAGTLDFA